MVGFALFSAEHLDADALEKALTDEYGAAVTRHVTGGHGTKEPETITLAVGDSGATVVVTPVDEPFPGEEAVLAAHPIWWEDPAPVTAHRSHVVIATLAPDGPADHALALASATLFSAVATLILEQPDAVAFFYGNGGMTFPAHVYTHYAREALEKGEMPTDLWVTVSPTKDEQGHTGGNTLGLLAFAHDDLIVDGSSREPSEIYFMLQNVARHIITSGDKLMPGTTITFEDDRESPVSAFENPWGGTLVRIEF